MRISDWSSDVCSSDLEKADSTMIFTRLALAKKGKQAVNIRCRFACGIPPNWQYLCKLTPFTARWFRFNPTRRAKIRLGPLGLLRRASIGAEGSPKQTRWGRPLSSKKQGLSDLGQRVSAARKSGGEGKRGAV